ncbi:MAG TPA: carboxypeptidase-like regulatory domain-containing protein [Gemmatimonadaceae bacterium]|nr:carboxypeptidase-like regulatory domain-containing protein [Gemmatimonadaceae bacterium]
MHARSRAAEYGVSRVAMATIRLAPLLAVLAAVPTAHAQVQARSEIEVRQQAVDPNVAPGTLTLTGAVSDAAGRPVVGAEAQVDGRRSALTDTTGRFTLRGVPFGPATLVVRRIGYERAAMDVAPTQPGLRVELAVRLAESSFRLPSVLVEGKAYDQGLWKAGFYKRQRVGFGTYFDPDFLAHYGGASLATLVREVPRVHVERHGNQEYAYGRLAGAACRLNVYVDGVFRRDAMASQGSGGRGVGLDVLLPKDELYAVEVYPTVNSVPAEFTRIGPSANPGVNLSSPAHRIPLPAHIYTAERSRREKDGELINSDAACGAIVIWTRYGMAFRAGSDSSRAR